MILLRLCYKSYNVIKCESHDFNGIDKYGNHKTRYLYFVLILIRAFFFFWSPKTIKMSYNQKRVIYQAIIIKCTVRNKLLMSIKNVNVFISCIVVDYCGAHNQNVLTWCFKIVQENIFAVK